MWWMVTDILRVVLFSYRRLVVRSGYREQYTADEMPVLIRIGVRHRTHFAACCFLRRS